MIGTENTNQSSARTIELHKGDRIIAVVPESCHGSGWSNYPVWVYVLTNDDVVRRECIQPHERTAELNALFRAGEEMCAALIAAVPVRSPDRQ